MRPPAHIRSHAWPRARWLKRAALIRPLFDRHRTDVATVSAGCIRFLYRWVDRSEVGPPVPFQVGLAPGRRVRPAVRRNRVRRLLREAVRQHQQLLWEATWPREEVLTLMILFRGDPTRDEPRIATDVPRALGRLSDRLAPPA
ncbi:MAG: ribonuclease P protein component [Bacteroidota bacterium]